MKRAYFHLLLLAVCAALAYANALSGPFIFDDEPAVKNNGDIRQLWPPDWAWPQSGSHPAVNSRPLVSFSLAVNYALGGLAVEGYHLVNIVLHILCGLVLYGVLGRLFVHVDGLASRAGPLALVSALIWILHPLNSQVVNYITQRSESLMGLCYLGTLYCFLRGIAPANWRWHIGAVICCALGMMAKEVMVSAPLAVLLCDGMFVAGHFGVALQRRWRLYAGLALGWLLLLRGLWSAPHGQTIGFGHGVDSWTYLLNQAQILTVYMRLVVWPYPLNLDYGYPLNLGLADVWWQALLILGIVALSGVAVYRGWRWGFVGAFALLVLAPTSSFVPIVNEVGADRRMYLPLAALVAGLLVAADALCGQWVRGRSVGLVLAGLVVLASALGTIKRNGDYVSGVAIWHSAVAAGRDNARAHYNLGVQLAAAGQSDQALTHYRRALVLNPDYREAHNNLGMLLVARGEVASALGHYRRVIELDPEFTNARVNLGIALVALDRMQEALLHFQRAVEADPDSHWARYNLGLALELSGEVAQAVVHYRWVLGINPLLEKVQYRLGLAYIAEGRLANAVFHLRKALALAPGRAVTHFHLGRALSRLDSTAESLEQYRLALARDPEMVEARYNLGTELMRMGDFASALPHLRQVVDLSPELAEARNNLGIALQRTGRWQAAVHEFRRAVQIRPDYGEALENLNAALATQGAGR